MTRALGLTGNLTIHGVTRPSTWDVTARVEGESILDIRLEYDFHFVREASPGTR